MPGASFTPEQIANAQAIINAGKAVGASNRDIQIALGVAITESGLNNDPFGDGTSLGLFQQTNAWGSAADRLDPARAATMFFTGGHGGQPGLFHFADRNQMGLGQVAQAVQDSAYPGRYEPNMTAAESLMSGQGYSVNPKGTLAAYPSPYDTTVQSSPSPLSTQASNAMHPADQLETSANKTAEAALGAVGGKDGFSPLDTPTFDSKLVGEQQTNPMAQFQIPSLSDFKINTTGLTGWRAKVVADAQKFLGTPYVWGGTSPSGFDCSGLVQYVFGQNGIKMPRLSWDQASTGQRTEDFSALQPGDLVAAHTDNQNAGATHIGIYVGNGMVIQAPHPGGSVELTPISNGFSGGWGVRLGGK